MKLVFLLKKKYYYTEITQALSTLSCYLIFDVYEVNYFEIK